MPNRQSLIERIRNEAIKQIAIFVLVIILVGISQLIHERGGAQDTANAKIMRDHEALIQEIGEFLVLPSDEKPTIATVTDKRKLIGQSLFVDAQNGDKLLAYPIAKKLILYRPVDKKIITLATIHD